MQSVLRRGLAGLLAALAIVSTAPVAGASSGAGHANSNAPIAQPLVIGHRGASGYRPEHTLAAYALAIDQGADFVEPDLVATADGVLVARHENEISETTDVEDHPEFAARRTTKVIDGRSIDGWFTEDFTLAELKTLRATERLPDVRPQNTAYDGLYTIPTLQEVIDLVQARSTRRRPIGLYPETKHPTYFDSISLSLEEPLVTALHANGYRRPTDPVFIQSFEVSNLQQLDGMTKLPLVQLLSGSGRPYDVISAGGTTTYRQMATAAGLRRISRYADGTGPTKDLVIPRNPDGTLASATTFVADAHRVGLLVHPYTFRVENRFLPAEYRSSSDPNEPGDLAGELRRYLAAGIDGFFTDNPDIGATTSRAPQ